METIQKQVKKQIGEWVAEDFRTAAVFSKYKIDFCCNGNRSITEACAKKAINSDALLLELEQVTNTTRNETIDYKSWPLDLLIDYIEKKHHRYVSEKIPVLKQFLNKLCKVHGERHPELVTINELFTASAGELTMHMKKEELILFPFVKKLVKANIEGNLVNSPQFETVENPIAGMMKEHDNEGARFREIAKLTNDYTPPSDACNTYKVTFAMLQDFEKDLHLHIHLENNILFPKAIILEAQTL
jgi:regulator of cell morphogenesis and NO signaling